MGGARCLGSFYSGESDGRLESRLDLNLTDAHADTRVEFSIVMHCGVTARLTKTYTDIMDIQLLDRNRSTRYPMRFL